MHCQLCWIVASMVLLDSKNIADAIVIDSNPQQSLSICSCRCLLRSDWVIAQLVWQNRLENRTSCNSFSPDFHVPGTFERHVTRYD